MKKIIDMHDAEFEHYVNRKLKSLGYIFPETDEQMAIFEKRVGNHPLPEEFHSPEFVFKNERKVISFSLKPEVNETAEKNWAIAAREGKNIPDDILDKMKTDRENARQKRNGNKQE
jgi:hypothetical protein